MKFLRRKHAHDNTTVPDALSSSSSVRSSSYSLGTGGLSVDGKQVEGFVPSPRSSKSRRENMSLEDDLCFGGVVDVDVDPPSLQSTSSASATEAQPVKISFRRNDSSFLRVTDLKLEETSTVDSSEESLSVNNFHHASIDPPPGIDHDPAEKWVALDDGEGQHAPIAPHAVEALVQSATELTLNNKSLWTPDHKTAKTQAKGWHECTWGQQQPPPPLPDDDDDDASCWSRLPPPGADGQQVLVWSGTFPYTGYGSELPAIRVAGIVPLSPEALLDLLIDSSRVHEYNKMSLGRKDILTLQSDFHGGTFGGVTKVLRSESRLLRKVLQFTSLLHARKILPSGDYQLVTRAVEGPKTSASAMMKSEILLGVNVLRRIPNDPNRCLLIAVNHIRSPMVPMMIAKRIGLQAAVNFIHDLRGAAAALSSSS